MSMTTINKIYISHYIHAAIFFSWFSFASSTTAKERLLAVYRFITTISSPKLSIMSTFSSHDEND